MTALPWSKFFWDDWESDEALKMCSPGAQALWMRMLCICAKADGYLSIAGRKLDADDLVRLTGWPAADVRAWLDELKRWGVFSVEGRGRIYCRRMVKGARKAAVARENGKNGGNPNLRNNTGVQASDNQNPTKDPTNAPGRSQKPEARSQRLELVPDPSEKILPQQNGQAVRRGSRLPEGWDGDEPGAAIVFAITEGLSDPEAFRALEDFRDYWRAKSGSNATKLDWMATWRRWVRSQRDRQGQRPAGRSPKRVGWV